MWSNPEAFDWGCGRETEENGERGRINETREPGPFLPVVCLFLMQATHTHTGTGKTLSANLKRSPPQRSRPLSLPGVSVCARVCVYSLLLVCDLVQAGQTSCPVPDRVIVALSVLGRAEAHREESHEPTGMNILQLVIQYPGLFVFIFFIFCWWRQKASDMRARCVFAHLGSRYLIELKYQLML